MLTSVLLGSEPELAQQDFTLTVDGNADVMSLPAGAYYLWNGEAALSLVSVLAEVVETHTELPTAAIFITEGGLVRIEASNCATFSITWGTATELRDLLGFTGNLTGALAYTATNPSPLIWIPRRTEIAEARLGVLGDPVYDTAVGQAAGSGAPVSTQHNVRLENAFTWRHVVNSVQDVELVRSKTGSQNGKWYGFHERVVRRFARFYLQRDHTFVANSTSPMTLMDSAPTSLGPFVWRPPASAVRYGTPREEENHESYNRVVLPVIVVDEYPT